MSLLLDALKKAAEQKAQKSQEEVPEQSTSDETLLRADNGDTSGFDLGDSGAQLDDYDDATELDHSEIRSRIESDPSQRIAGDETGFDITDGSFNDSRAIPRDDAEETGLEISDPDPPARTDSGLSTTGTGEDTGIDIPDVTEFRSGAAISERPAEDETGLDLADLTDSRAAPVKSDRANGDETGIDFKEDLEATPVPLADDSPGGDETGLDIADVTDSRPPEPSEQLQTGDDETIYFEDDEDVTRLEEDTGFDYPVEAARDESGEPVPADEESADGVSLRESVDIADVPEEPGFAAEISDDDATVQRVDDDDDETVQRIDPEDDEIVQRLDDDDETVQRIDDDEDETVQRLSDDDETVQRVDDDEDETVQRVDEDQDLSLMLVDPTDTNAANVLSKPDLPSGTAEYTPGAPEGLGLVGIEAKDDTGGQADTGPTAITNQTQVIGGADETRQESSITQSTLLRGEPTSTRTYAPDNYDRTLRPPGEDPSSVFSGMNTETDVVMTPDYAKKVFTSKTSERRAQNYKVYSGIAVVILIGIGAFGAYQYQNVATEIDTSLQALKRDPMPGAIKLPEPEEVDLFSATDPDNSARTIEIIESANERVDSSTTEIATEQATDVDVDEPVVADSGAEAEVVASTEAEIVTETATEPETEVETVASVETEAEVQVEEVPAPIKVTRTETAETEQAPIVESKSIVVSVAASDSQAQVDEIANRANLHIESTTQVTETSAWLHEAYEAYRRGDNARAMQLYNQVLEVEPGNRNALLARAAINIQEGYVEAAIYDYRQLLLANPKDSLAMSSMLAVASYSPEETETQLKLMIRDEPDSPYLNFALANAYGAQNRWQEAQGYYFIALKNNPEDPNYAYNLAVSLEHISQPGSAITYYRRALDNFENGLATFSRQVVDERLQVLGKL